MRAAIFPDSEAVAATWLRSRPELAGIQVSTDLRGYTAGQRRIVITRVGGVPSLAIRVDNPRLDVDVFGTDKADAHDLAQLARALLHELPTGDHTALDAVVANVADDVGLQWLPDPDTQAARYVLTLRLAVHPYP